MAINKSILLAVAGVLAAGAGITAVIMLRQPAPHATTKGGAPAEPAAVAPKPAGTQTTPPPPADCLLPGPAPVPQSGATATAADMKLSRDAIQHFVEQLEAYQACRNSQADHAAPGVTAAQKEQWIELGNAAVDEANAEASAFAQQLQIFKARNGGK